MAFKYVLLSLCALLGAANAGILGLAPATYVSAPVVAKLAQPHYDAVGTTQQNDILMCGSHRVHGRICHSHMTGKETSISICYQSAQRDEVTESHDET